MNKLDLALNNLQCLICHKTKPNRQDFFNNFCIDFFTCLLEIENLV